MIGGNGYVGATDTEKEIQTMNMIMYCSTAVEVERRNRDALFMVDTH